MKYCVAFLIVLLFSCRSDPKLLQSSYRPSISNHYYFVDRNGNQFTCVELKDSLLTIYEFDLDIGAIQKCVIKSTKEESKGCNKCIVEHVFNSNSSDKNLFLDSLLNLDKPDFNSIIKSYSDNFGSLDSMAFWSKASLFLDSVIFDLSRDKYLLDYTYSSNKIDQYILIDRINLSKDIAIDKMGLPKLFFDIEIDKNGKIKYVEYNSWGKELYKDLIVEIKRILRIKSLKSYSILNYPINIKLQIGIIIR